MSEFGGYGRKAVKPEQLVRLEGKGSPFLVFIGHLIGYFLAGAFVLAAICVFLLALKGLVSILR